MWLGLSLLLALAGNATWLDVPFTKQPKDGCGSASIWMVMQYWKPGETPAIEKIQQSVFSRDGDGVFESDMEMYFKSHRFQTFSLSGTWDDLDTELSKGWPIIVCLGNGGHGTPLHYVVVSGIDREHNLLLVNDPADRKLKAIGRREFEKRWRSTDNWALLVLPDSTASDASTSPPQVAATIEESQDLLRASEAFRNEDYATAKRYALRAERSNPKVPVTDDLLGTLYYIDDNLEAALKYWNRVDKPRIHDVFIDPPVKLDPVLMDRAFGFSRGEVLTLDEYRRTVRRLGATAAFSDYHFELIPTASDSFDLKFRGADRSGVHYLAWLREVPFRTIEPVVTDVDGRTINISSLIRWDPSLRRAYVSVSAPLESNSATRLALSTDGREEVWAYNGGTLNVRKDTTQLLMKSELGSRSSWASGVKFVVRNGGQQIGYVGSIKSDLVRWPEHRLVVTGNFRAEADRAGSAKFGKAEPSLRLHWVPDAQGKEYAVNVQARAGVEGVRAPIDELFSLGMDRDSDLLLRARPPVESGPKGSVVVNPRYALFNADCEKMLHNFGGLRISAGPFVDAAKTSQWYAASGLGVRLSLGSSVSFLLSLGRDLRSHQTVFFANSGQTPF